MNVLGGEKRLTERAERMPDCTRGRYVWCPPCGAYRPPDHALRWRDGGVEVARYTCEAEWPITEAERGMDRWA